MRRLVIALALAAAAVTLVSAHDIPRDIVIHALVKPQGDRLNIVLRMPVEAIRDTPFPRLANNELDIPRTEPLLRDGVAQWLLPGLEIREEDGLLAPPEIASLTILAREQFEVTLAYRIGSDRSRFSIRPGFERLGLKVLTALVFNAPDGTIRAFSLHGDPGVVPLDPRWHQAVWHFVKVGFVHILEGADHLLFLVCLVIPFRRLRPLILVVTAFTAAHSVALIAAAWNFVPDALWFPPLVETLIAASVFYMAIENIVSDSAPKRRVMMAFGFGLVHGFGFSFALKETMQFAGSHLLSSLFAFNLGVEIGQVLVLLVLVPLLGLLFTRVMKERIGIIVLSVIAAHVAWHWMADRWNALSQFPLPSADAGTALFLVRAAIVIVILAAAYRGIRALKSRERQPAS